MRYFVDFFLVNLIKNIFDVMVAILLAKIRHKGFCKIIKFVKINIFYIAIVNIFDVYKYLKMLDVSPSDLGRLKVMPLDQIHEANRQLRKLVLREGNANCCFSPTIDGVTIPDKPGEMAKSFSKPILIGTTSQEGDLFVMNIPNIALPLAAYWFKFKFRPGKGAHRYMADDFTATFYRNPAYDIARNMIGDAWVYEYRYQTPNMLKAQSGCCHACELPLLFGKSNAYINIDDPVSQRVGEKLREIWGEFAYNGSLSWKKFKVDGEVKGIE